MWVRKRIDISPVELMTGMVNCISLEARESVIDRISNHWVPGKTFTCLSVRSGFDLLLATLNWPAGSQILMSGMTIPDMSRIVEEHGLVPVGLDVDPQTLSVSAEQIKQHITPQTKAIVVAHLFGGLCDLEPILEVAREHKLLVIEDCAQAYAGCVYKGDDRADISMFSFGAIKTNSSLCGGVFVVRRDELLKRLNRAHQRWTTQTRVTYLRRLFKYTCVKFISTRRLAGCIAGLLRLIGKDHDRLAVKLSRGFSGGDFFGKIRQQPSVPLLRLMEHKFKRFDESQIVLRTHRGERLGRALRPQVDVLGSQSKRPTYWVFPILCENPSELVRHLWSHGFDATTSCSMHPVQSAVHRSDLSNVHQLLRYIVFLPFDLAMPEAELTRMAKVILEFGPNRVDLDAPLLSDPPSQHASI